MIRVCACTMRSRCHCSCPRSRFSQLGTQTGGKSSFNNKPRIAAHLADPTSAYTPVCAVSRPHLPSTTRTATPPAVVRTSVHHQLYSGTGADIVMESMMLALGTPREELRWDQITASGRTPFCYGELSSQ